MSLHINTGLGETAVGVLVIGLQKRCCNKPVPPVLWAKALNRNV